MVILYCRRATKKTGARVYVVLPLFYSKKKKSWKVASSESCNSASLRSVLFEIHRYNTRPDFTKTALHTHHVLLECAIYTFLQSPEFKLRKRKGSCFSSCRQQVYKSPTTPPISSWPFRLVHLGTYERNTSTHPSSFLIPTSSSSQKYDFQNWVRDGIWCGLQTLVFHEKHMSSGRAWPADLHTTLSHQNYPSRAPTLKRNDISCHVVFCLPCRQPRY